MRTEIREPSAWAGAAPLFASLSTDVDHPAVSRGSAELARPGTEPLRRRAVVVAEEDGVMAVVAAVVGTRNP